MGQVLFGRLVGGEKYGGTESSNRMRTDGRAGTSDK